MAAVAADLVADSTDGSNESAVVSGVDFAAQIVDVDLDNVGHRGRKRPKSCLQVCYPLTRFRHL